MKLVPLPTSSDSFDLQQRSSWASNKGKTPQAVFFRDGPSHSPGGVVFCKGLKGWVFKGNGVFLCVPGNPKESRLWRLRNFRGRLGESPTPPILLLLEKTSGFLLWRPGKLTNCPWKSNNFDGICRERWLIFHGELLVPGRLVYQKLTNCNSSNQPYGSKYLLRRYNLKPLNCILKPCIQSSELLGSIGQWHHRLFVGDFLNPGIPTTIKTMGHNGC